jgi:hypothetical protein
LKSELRAGGNFSAGTDANRVLEALRQDYNRRFSVAARETANDFRPLGKKLNWDRLFSLRYERVVGEDHVTSMENCTSGIGPEYLFSCRCRSTMRRAWRSAARAYRKKKPPRIYI